MSECGNGDHITLVSTTFLYNSSFLTMIHETLPFILRKILNPLCLGFLSQPPYIRHHSFNRGGRGAIYDVQVWKLRWCLFV